MKALAVQRSKPMECACAPLVLPNSFKPGHSLLGGEFLDSHFARKIGFIHKSAIFYASFPSRNKVQKDKQLAYPGIWLGGLE